MREASRLIRRPNARGVAHPGADRERGDDLRIHGVGEIDDPLPFAPGEDALESFRRAGRGRSVGLGKRSPISPTRKRLYASLRSEPYSVSTFAIQPGSGKRMAALPRAWP